MTQFLIPPEGLEFLQNHGEEQPKRARTQILRLDLARKTTDQILESLRNKDKVQLHFGKKPTIHFGKTSIPLDASRDAFPSELYRQHKGSNGPLYFAGKISHTLEIQQAKEATAKTDAALAALENSLKSIQEQKASNETSFVRNQKEMKELHRKQHTDSHKPSPLLSASNMHKGRLMERNARSVPGSPSFAAAWSSRSAPTSAPMLSSFPQAENKIRVDAISIPLLHILAVKPMTPALVSKMMRAPLVDCERLMLKFTRDTRDANGFKELKEKSYRELDVWKFPYKTQEDRQKAIDHAVQAFDRMRIEKKDHLWQMLLPEEERGKGKVLSKLNFDRPIAPPRLDGGRRVSPDDDSSLDNGNDNRGRLQVKAHIPSRAKSHDPSQKSANEKMSPAKHGHGRTPLGGKEHSKTEGKYKSSEKIEDSDEEAEAAKVVVIKASTPELARSESHGTSQSRRPPSSPMAKKSYHKSKLSTSSTSLDQPANRPRTFTNESSPPTSSTDQESSSTKRSSQSSATSSPPSSIDMPQRKTFSPIVSEVRKEPTRGRSPAKHQSSASNPTNNLKQHSPTDVSPKDRRPRSISSPIKRKAPTNEHTDAQPPKKQHLSNGTSRPVVTRKESESESISSPEKPEQTTSRMLEKTQRFQKYYEQYKTLHERVSKNEANKQEADKLWTMHNRLKDMKEEIWRDYRSLGEPGKIEL
jgi:RNA polymerase II elongation factor ELL